MTKREKDLKFRLNVMRTKLKIAEDGVERRLDAVRADRDRAVDQLNAWRIAPLKMILFCPLCSARHIDIGEWASRIHHTHSCQSCGFTWRPAVEPTLGVQFLPGFKNE